MNQRSLYGKKEMAVKVFEEHFDHLVLYVNSLVDDIPTSEDIVQDMFLKLWEKDRLEDYTLGFLYVCAKNAALNYLRTQNTDSFSTDNLEMFDMEDKVEEETAYMDKLEQIYQAIEALSPQCRVVLKKIYFENKSYAETAEEMHLSLNTVKTHVYLAIRSLKKDFAYIFFIL